MATLTSTPLTNNRRRTDMRARLSMTRPVPFHTPAGPVYRLHFCDDAREFELDFTPMEMERLLADYVNAGVIAAVRKHADAERTRVTP